MIYIDSSVILAELLVEDRRPPESVWTEVLVASRLVEYEVWNRLHALGRAGLAGEMADDLLSRVDKVEMTPFVLARALGSMPTPVRTLDALHVATALFLSEHRTSLQLATYDGRLAAAARTAGIRVLSLEG